MKASVKTFLTVLLLCSLPLGCASPANTASDGNAAAGNAIEVTATMGNAVEASVYRYTVEDCGVSEESYEPAPREKVVPAADAARSALRLLLGAYGEDFPSSGTVYVSFANVMDVSMELYYVCFGEPAYYKAPFYAMVNAHDGTALSATRSYEPGEEIEDSDTFRWEDYDDGEIVAKTYAAAVSLATDARFTRATNEPTVLADSYIDGVQATFRTVDPICSDAYLHMDDGSCYSMRIYYPSMTITNVSVYPDWEYCRQGTFFEEYLMDWGEPGTAAQDEALPPAPTPPPTDDLPTQKQ